MYHLKQGWAEWEPWVLILLPSAISASEQPQILPATTRPRVKEEMGVSPTSISLHFKPEEYNTTSLGAQLMPHFQEEATKTPRRDMSYLRSPCAMARSSVEPGAGPWHTLENLLKKHELQTNWVPSPCLPITHSVPGSTFLTAQPQFISCSKYQLL